MTTIGFAIGLVLYLGFITTRCFFRVNEGHVAVLTSFGAVVRAGGGKEGRVEIHGPGLHRKLPWQHPHDVSVKEQNLDLSGEKGGRSVMAQDGTVLRVDSILRYAPVEEELEQYLFGLRAPREHITGLFSCLLRNEIANFGPASTAVVAGERPTAMKIHTGDDVTSSYAVILRERRALNQRIEKFCHDRIEKGYGVRFRAVDLTDILPPDELADALNAVLNTETDWHGRYARAEAECRQRVVAAQRGVDIASARAEAVQTEIGKLAGFLDELQRQGVLAMYLRRRRAEVHSEARSTFVRSPA
jgi:regulator of protease activity HflC (stomatin/prohibitin superfamily)